VSEFADQTKGEITMNAGVLSGYTLTLSEQERKTLLDLLDVELRDTHVELRRTDSMGAKEDVRAQEATLHSLLQKLREAKPT